jgi:hypothetical protein
MFQKARYFYNIVMKRPNFFDSVIKRKVGYNQNLNSRGIFQMKYKDVPSYLHDIVAKLGEI